jgi:hypothetical protein
METRTNRHCWLLVLALAQELGGEYDGWETTVEKGI